ncbi:retrovirus-related pol polyprotein from transposon TNT 1-94 [Tanacetum coccineum]
MTDFFREKHVPEKIACNLKFLNNLQPEWNRHVTTVHQTKDLYQVDYTQLYDFLKFNQAKVNEIRAERLAKAHDPLALMAHSQTLYNYPVFHQDHPSHITYMQHPPPNNNYNPQPSFNQNYMQQPMPNPEDISDPTTAINMTLVLMAKAFKINYSTPTNNNQRISSNPHNKQIAQPGMNIRQDRQIHMIGGHGGNRVVHNVVQNLRVHNVGNQNGLIVDPGIAHQNANYNGNGNVVAARAEGNVNRNNGNQIMCYNYRGLGHYARNCTVRPMRRGVAYLQLLIAQKEKAGIQLQAEEFDLMVAVGDIDVIEDVNANYEEQYIELLEPILEPYQVQQNDNNVISDASSVEQSGGTHDPPVVYDSNGSSSIRVDNTSKTRRPQPMSNTKNDRVPYASKNLYGILAIWNDKAEVVCAMCKQCLITANHDVCVLTYVNDINSRDTKQSASVSKYAKQKKHKLNVKKPKKVGSKERLASPTPSEPRICRRWSPTRRLFDSSGKISRPRKSNYQFDCSNGDNACISNPHEPSSKRFPNSTSSLGSVDLLKGNRTTNLYTINLYEMASASPICLIAPATFTKSLLWHQQLSHFNFDTINDLAKNDLVTGLPKFKYHKEHLCPSCEKGKGKKASHPPKPIPNSKKRLHLLHMDLCGPMRVENINGKRYVLVIVDDYSSYTWVYFLKSKDEAPEVIKTFLKKNIVLLQAPVIFVRTDNGAEFKNHVLKEYFNSVGISHQALAVRTPQQNRVMERRNRTLVEAARTIIRALCYPNNDREDLGKPSAKAMAFEQCSSKPRIQGMTSGKISSGLDLTYAFGQPSAATRTSPAAQSHQWTKDHPLEQVIGEPSRPVLTRNQLRTNGDMCMYALTVSTMEPSNVKQAMTDPAWIDSMQEELLQFKRLDHDEENTIIRNKTHLVVRGYRQEEGINFEDSFAPVAKEGKKALYGLKQAPRAWYDELSKFLLQNHFFKGTIDPTLFLRCFNDDILVPLRNIDDGGNDFFLGLQVNQPPCAIFINQSNYVLEILKKYGLETCDLIGTPIEINDKLDLDKNGTLVDAMKYRSMIGALMYLTSSRPDIVHATCICARYQAKPTEKHLKEVKRIFRYLRGTINIGEKLVSWSSKKQDCTSLSTAEAEYVSLSA